MIVLIPVCHYRVHYQIASGRPFSVFERLVLEAIHDGSGTLETLEACFHLHRRVITEAVVTLMQAGWVAINRNNHILVTTESGKAGIRSEGALPGNIRPTRTHGGDGCGGQSRCPHNPRLTTHSTTTPPT